jgi:hypothetical protein
LQIIHPAIVIFRRIDMKGIICSALLLFTCSSLSFAEDFAHLDGNRDGSLSRDEFMKCFENADTNKDGKLSQAEHESMLKDKDARGRFGGEGLGSSQKPDSSAGDTYFGSEQGKDSRDSSSQSPSSGIERQSK